MNKCVNYVAITPIGFTVRSNRGICADPFGGVVTPIPVMIPHVGIFRIWAQNQFFLQSYQMQI